MSAPSISPAMPPATPGESPRTRGLALLLYWGGLALGVLVPLGMQGGVEVWRRKTTLAAYLDGFYVRLFAPADGLLALTLLGAAPFAVYAIFALIHLGTAPGHGAPVARRRGFGLLLALATMVAVSVWGHLAILTAKGSTAGIGFLFLPFYVLFALPVAYGIGRWVARRLVQ